MFKIGLKLWSTNKNYVKEAERLFDQGYCQYIELFAVPNTYDDYAVNWKNVNVPFVIHAAHSTNGGLNLSNPEMFKLNMALTLEAQKYADLLCSEFVIFHSGINGNIAETSRQINLINDSRFVIENKPYFGLVGDNRCVCVGCLPEEILYLKNNCNIKFCLDIGHAVYAANALKKDKINFIDEFIELRPVMYHLSDGNWLGVNDDHEKLGNGSFRFDQILRLLSKGSIVTIETKHIHKDSLDDFMKEVLFLRENAAHV